MARQAPAASQQVDQFYRCAPQTRPICCVKYSLTVLEQLPHDTRSWGAAARHLLWHCLRPSHKALSSLVPGACGSPVGWFMAMNADTQSISAAACKSIFAFLQELWQARSTSSLEMQSGFTLVLLDLPVPTSSLPHGRSKSALARNAESMAPARCWQQPRQQQSLWALKLCPASALRSAKLGQICRSVMLAGSRVSRHKCTLTLSEMSYMLALIEGPEATQIQNCHCALLWLYCGSPFLSNLHDLASLSSNGTDVRGHTDAERAVAAY